MWKSIKVTLKWILFGFLVGFCLAVAGAGPGGASAIFLFLGIVLGAILSIVHSLIRYYRDENREKLHLIPSGITFLFICFPFVSNLIIQTNCSISKTESFTIAQRYVKEQGLYPSFLKPEAYKLRGCELGFEYGKVESTTLEIVTSDGSVRFND